MTPEDIQRAIDVVENSRRTHVEWGAWLKENPDAALEPRPQVDVAGDIAHHDECIAGYDHVLKVLRQL